MPKPNPNPNPELTAALAEAHAANARADELHLVGEFSAKAIAAMNSILAMQYQGNDRTVLERFVGRIQLFFDGKIDEELKAAQDLLAEQEANCQTVAAKAAEIAASAGHVPVPIRPDGGYGQAGKKTEAELLEEFNAITDPNVRAAFYEKHFAPKFKK